MRARENVAAQIQTLLEVSSVMKTPNWLLSKWLHYGLLVIFLFFLWLWLLPMALNGHDLATNLIAEIFGLIFTLAVFVMFFEWREKLEWKSVEGKVKKRIGRQIQVIFIELYNLCGVERVLVGDSVFDDRAWNELKRKQLDKLSSEKVELNDLAKELWEKRDLASNLASFFDSRRAYLSEVEGKYLKFLDSELQSSLMDIQDYLEGLRFELRVIRAKKERFYESLSDLIGKIMKEIARIRKCGIDIGF